MLKPYGSLVLLKRVEREKSNDKKLTLPESQRYAYEVVAIGPGRFNPEVGYYRLPDVVIGDRVVLRDDAWKTEVYENGEKLLLVDDQFIAAIL